MQISQEPPIAADIIDLLQEHLNDMAQHSPPESVHALDLPALRASNITFFTARTSQVSPAGNNNALMGCAALKTLSEKEGELKSMRTAAAHRRKGVAGALLEEVIQTAMDRGMTGLSLETGTPAAFEAARALYASRGFKICPPFADYTFDPFSVCMHLELV